MTSENNRQLITYKYPESQNLEYKKTLYQFVSTMDAPQPKKEKDKYELLKDVVAMANGGGGTIILGISEDNDGIPDTRDNEIGLKQNIPPKYLENIEQLIGAKVFPKLTVTVKKISVSLNTAEKLFIVISISAPIHPLYCVQNTSDSFTYYQRFGRQIKQMSPTEITFKLSQHSSATHALTSEKHDFFRQFQLQKSSTPTLTIIAQLPILINQDVLADSLLKNEYMRGQNLIQENHWHVVDDEINHFAYPTLLGVATSTPNKTMEVRRSGTILFHRNFRHGEGLARIQLKDGSQIIIGDFWLIDNHFLVSTVMNYFLFIKQIYTHWNVVTDVIFSVALINAQNSFLESHNKQLFSREETVREIDIMNTNEYSPKRCQDKELLIDWQSNINALVSLSDEELREYIFNTVISRIANGFGLYQIKY